MKQNSEYYIHQMLVSRELGGAGLIALELAAGLEKRGQQTVTWIPGQGPAATRAEEMGIAYHQYEPTKALGHALFPGLLCNWKIGQLLRRRSPGLIHVHSPFHYGALAPAFKLAGLNTVVHVHLEEDKPGLRWALKRPPDVIITCARFLVDYVRSVLPDRIKDTQRVIAVPNAVDLDRFHVGDRVAAKLQVGAPLQSPLVLMVANLAPHKGHDTAVKAAAILKAKGIVAHFWFAGSTRKGGTEYANSLNRLVDDLRVADKVRFLGQRNDIPDLLRAADYFMLPSAAEGLPLAILEAQASKVVVLAAPTAGVPEIITNETTGFLIPSFDASSYANRLAQLIGTPGSYTKIVDAAYANLLKDYGWKTYLERVEEIYSSFLPSV